MAGTEREEVVYVLGTHVHPHARWSRIREYYTGKKPTEFISEAKTYKTREIAHSVQKYAHTGIRYQVMKTTRKRIFKMTLAGK